MKVRTHNRGARRATNAEGGQAPNGKRARPLSPEEHLTLKEDIHHLYVQYGRGFVRAEVNRRPERNHKRGQPKKWSITQLLSLWLIVQSFAKQTDNNLSKACEALEELGGICHLVLKDGMLVEQPVVIRKERIRRLYYDAETSLKNFDNEVKVKFPKRAEGNKIINGNLKEHLSFYAGAQGVMRMAFAPVLDDVAYFIYSEFYRRGIVPHPPNLPEEIIAI